MRLPLIMLMLIGCEQSQMSEEWQLDRIRLLGVRAEVQGIPDPVLGIRAEPQPGETVQFSSLTYAPPDTPDLATMWVACLPESELSYGCSIDESLFEQLEEVDPETDPAAFFELLEAIQAAGFIGFEPGWAPEWDIPADALDDLSDEERLEGTNAFVNITIFPDGEDLSTEGEDTDDTEIGFKRMVVSEAPTPNHNPDIVDVLIAGTSIGSSPGFTARKGLTYTIEPVLADGHIETYQFRNSNGEDEWRTEEPYFSWYTEMAASKKERQARFDQNISLHPYAEVEWTAPMKAGIVEIRIVVRDRRGGMGWRSLTVNVL